MPTIRAAIALNRESPEKSIELLDPATSYGLRYSGLLQVGAMCPTYIRGQAYVNLHQGKEAAAEFQKFLNHPVVALNYPLAALAHLGLGCAYAMQGNAARRPCGKFRRLAANCKKGTATGKQESRVTEDAWAPRHVVMKIKNRTD